MSEIMQKMSDMIKNNEIPDSIKNILNNLGSSTSGTSSSSNSNMQNNETSNSENNNLNIDMETMLKMKSIIDSMNKGQNDPRANLLRSLKPYLKPSRKEKVDQYIKMLNMSKVMELFNDSGGEIKK